MILLTGPKFSTAGDNRGCIIAHKEINTHYLETEEAVEIQGKDSHMQGQSTLPTRLPLELREMYFCTMDFVMATQVN